MSHRSTETTALVTQGAASTIAALTPKTRIAPGKVPARIHPNGVMNPTGESSTPGGWFRNSRHQKG